MKTVVLVNPPLSLEERYGTLAKAGTILPPLGLTVLAAVLRDKGRSVRLIDAAAQGLSCEETAQKILKIQPSYVGFTAVTVSVHHAARIATLVKKTRPGIYTLLGGPHLTAVPEKTFQRFREFDVGVVGEGEITTPRLLDALDKITTLDDIPRLPGLIYRQEGQIIRTGRSPAVEDLDTLPMNAWDLLTGFPFIYKSSVHKLGGWPTTSLVTSRGCVGRCRFCDNSMFGRKVRGYSAGYLTEEIAHLTANYNIKDVFMSDDNFVLLKDRLYEFCDLLRQHRLKITWGCYSRVDSIDGPEVLKMMKTSGCWRITYGLESGAQEILDFYRKEQTLEQMEQVVRWTRQAGIKVKGFFMIGNFLETHTTLSRTLDFIKHIKLDDFHMTYFTPLPNTELYQLADRYGTFDKDWHKMSLWHPLFIPEGLTKRELETFRKRAFLSFYVGPRNILSHIASIRTFTDLKKIFRGYSTLLGYALKKKSGEIKENQNKKKEKTVGFIHKMIARGYHREVGSAPPTAWLVNTNQGSIELCPEEQVVSLLGTGYGGGIGFICPTYVSRASCERQINVVQEMLQQLVHIRRSFSQLPLIFFVGMQWDPGQEILSQERLEVLARLAAHYESEGIRFVGLMLRGPGKSRTLNAIIHIAHQLRFKALGWVDDDIQLEPCCLEQIVGRFLEKGSKGAVGATKIPESKKEAASRLLYHIKKITNPASNYPHGCCILVEVQVLSDGIPDRYYDSDDGYICFELLDPSLENPLEYLELVPTARCRYYVGGTAGQIIKRIRRVLLHHHVFLADYPPEVGKYYFSQILFYGLWPFAPWDKQKSLPMGCLKWFLKFLYLVWFLRVGIELFFRGLFKIPLKEIP
jgi:radical SAM superfamily enzyme YgiQ (UPF0313 family)